MKPFKISTLHIAMGALAAASIVAGCNGSGSGAGVSALGQAPISYQRNQKNRRAKASY